MRRSSLAVVLFAFVIIIQFNPCSILPIQAQTGDAWWNEEWSHRKHHVIIGSTAGEQTNYPILINVYRAVGIDTGDSVYVGALCETNFADIRFTTDGQSPVGLDYWIEEEIYDFSAKIWVEIPLIPASPGTTSIYIYYGNPHALEVSNGDETFLFFDDFEDGTLDPTKWAEHNMDVGASFSESGGNLIVTDVSVEDDTWMLYQGLMAQSSGTHWNPLDHSFKITLESVHWDSADPDASTPVGRWGVSLSGTNGASDPPRGDLSLYMSDAWGERGGRIYSNEDDGETEHESGVVPHEATYDFFLYKDDDNTVDTYYDNNIGLYNIEQINELNYLLIQYSGDETQNYQEMAIETFIFQKWIDPEPSHGVWIGEGSSTTLLLLGGIVIIIIIGLVAASLWIRQRRVKAGVPSPKGRGSRAAKQAREPPTSPIQPSQATTSTLGDVSQETPSEFLVSPEMGPEEAALKQQARQEEKRVMQWMRDAMTSFEEGRYRHAAVDAWTVVEALLNVAYEQYLGEPKPQISYHKVIQKLIPHLPGGRLTGWSLQHARRLRNKIHPDSPEPSPVDVERIIVVAQQMCLWLGLPLSQLVPPSVHILKEAASEPCLVCSLELRVGQRVITAPCCEAVVHYEHIIEWVRAKGHCPKCRTLLSYRSGQIRIT